jgi:phenylalanyl-tRNA synthetase beta chain
VDFFDVKGDLEALAAPRGLATASAEHPLLHPGRSARVLVDGSDVGWLGELHPRIVKEFELPRAPIAFELRLDALVARGIPAGTPVSRLPIVRRDMAVVVDESVPR